MARFRKASTSSSYSKSRLVMYVSEQEVHPSGTTRSADPGCFRRPPPGLGPLFDFAPLDRHHRPLPRRARLGPGQCVLADPLQEARSTPTGRAKDGRARDGDGPGEYRQGETRLDRDPEGHLGGKGESQTPRVFFFGLFAPSQGADAADLAPACCRSTSKSPARASPGSSRRSRNKPATSMRLRS